MHTTYPLGTGMVTHTDSKGDQMQKENASGDLVIFSRFSYLCTAGRIANPKVQPGVLLEP